MDIISGSMHHFQAEDATSKCFKSHLFFCFIFSMFYFTKFLPNIFIMILPAFNSSKSANGTPSFWLRCSSVGANKGYPKCSDLYRFEFSTGMNMEFGKKMKVA